MARWRRATTTARTARSPKRRDSRAQLAADRAALERFTAWAAAQREDRLALLFTPWGEGLVRSWYRRTLVELSRLPHIHRVAIQTNLSCRTDWLDTADLDTLALWCTFHPGQTPYDRFLAKCRDLAARGVRHSVGVVGLPGHLEQARRLRTDLPAHVYLWVNAAEGHTYTDAEADRWTALAPCSRTAATRTAARACPVGQENPSSLSTARAQCAAATSSRRSWATSTTAPTAGRCAPAPAR